MNYEISVRAGPENQEIYRYVNSPIPKGIKSVNNLIYRSLSVSALEAATEIVRVTGKNIMLKLSIEER